MDLMRNYQFEEEYDGSAVEADVAAFRRAKVAGIDSGHELRSDWLEPSLPMLRDGAAATGSIANQVDDAPRSRDPLDAYFRNLDNAELLSRDEELALAKRIDQAQRALLICLCRIPLIVERVGAWGDELRDGRLRLSYLLDAVPSDGLEAAEDDLLGDDGSLDVSTECGGPHPAAGTRRRPECRDRRSCSEAHRGARPWQGAFTARAQAA